VEDDYEIAEALAEEHPPRDPAIDHAIERLQAFFRESPQRLFYSTQIETLLEREFFYWIVGKGLLELGNSQRIQRMAVPVEGQTINFYANRKHRYVRRELKTMLNVLRRIFHPEFAHAIGRHGELMFDAALGRHGSELKRRTRTIGTIRHGRRRITILTALSREMASPMESRSKTRRTTSLATSYS